jgi:hypothetical protein
MDKDSQALTKASFITALSLIIGLAYYLYLTNISSPRVFVRIVPFVWLISSVIGFSLGTQAHRTRALRFTGITVAIVSLLSTLFAALFSLAALMGD